MDNNKRQSFTLMGFIDNNHEILTFAGASVFIFAVLQLIYFQIYLGSTVFYVYLGFCAQLSTDLLLMIGESVELIGRTIKSEIGPSVTVVEGCDALRIYSVLIAVILAYRAPFLSKLTGIILGVGFMFIFNILRISLLLWIDVHFTDWFDFFHHTILPFGLWLIAILYFYAWGESVAIDS